MNWCKYQWYQHDQNLLAVCFTPGIEIIILSIFLSIFKSHWDNHSFMFYCASCTRGTPAPHLNEPAGGSCCDAGLGLVWRCNWIYMSFVCLIQKKIYFELLRGQGCVESKNMTSVKRKIHYELIKFINNPSWLIQMLSDCCQSCQSTWFPSRGSWVRISKFQVW